LNTDKLRSRLQEVSLSRAKSALINVVRRKIRVIIYEYAEQNHIVDFDDAILVSQVCRDFRQDMLNKASPRIADIQAATSINDLLVVFDSMVSWLES